MAIKHIPLGLFRTVLSGTKKRDRKKSKEPKKPKKQVNLEERREFLKKSGKVAGVAFGTTFLGKILSACKSNPFGERDERFREFRERIIPEIRESRNRIPQELEHILKPIISGENPEYDPVKTTLEIELALGRINREEFNRAIHTYEEIWQDYRNLLSEESLRRSYRCKNNNILLLQEHLFERRGVRYFKTESLADLLLNKIGDCDKLCILEYSLAQRVGIDIFPVASIDENGFGHASLMFNGKIFDYNHYQKVKDSSLEGLSNRDVPDSFTPEFLAEKLGIPMSVVRQGHMLAPDSKNSLLITQIVELANRHVRMLGEENFAEIVSLLSCAIRLSPTSFFAKVALGNHLNVWAVDHHENLDFSEFCANEALKLFDEVLSTHPTHPYAFTNKFNALRRLDNIANQRGAISNRAIEFLESAFSEYPDSPVVRTLYGVHVTRR